MAETPADELTIAMQMEERLDRFLSSCLQVVRPVPALIVNA